MADRQRVAIRGKGWRKTSSIDAHKFEVIAEAILSTLTEEPVSFTMMVDRVTKHVKIFEGSIAWYTISCARELEVRGDLVREDKPVRYRRAAKGRARSGGSA